jgi:membrane protease YdiL (CAAX protease family)
MTGVPHPLSPWHWWIRAWGNAVVAALGLGVLAIAGLFVVGPANPWLTTPAGTVVVTAAGEALLGFAGLWAWWRCREAPALRPTPWRWPDFAAGVSAGVLVGVCLTAVAVAASLLHVTTPGNAGVVLGNSLRTTWTTWGIAVVVAGIGPVAEEILFRGVLQPTLTAAAGPWVGIGVVSLVFALLHQHEATGPAGMWLWAFILPVGVVAGWLRYRRGLAGAVGVHMAFNSLSLLLILR